MSLAAEGTICYSTTSSNWQRWVSISFLVYLLLVAVATIGSGFKSATAGQAVLLFDFASNPLIALIIGIVATALIQSSSTVTSVIVGMVAGGMPLSIAIPMIMGANIGTSLTSTIVSLGHIRDGIEFKRAFSAATVHDSFNLLAVAIILPIELLFRPLERLAGYFATFFRPGATADVAGFNPVGAMLEPATDLIGSLSAVVPGIWGGLLMIILGVAMILIVIKLLGSILKKVMVGRALDIMHRTIGRGPVSGIGAGGIITVLVQSSSTTTSLIVPMAGSGVFSLKQVYPFVLGANLGTTITALIAAIAITGPLAVLALQIALVHLFFNLFAIILIYSIPLLRNIPVIMAEYLARLAQKNKLFVAAYIFGAFFITPLFLIGFLKLLGI